MLIHYLPVEYENQVWELLKLADHEFIPPLSVRHSTTQGNLLTDRETANRGPVEYFDSLKEQQFCLYIADKFVVGFMSYITDHMLEIPTVRDALLVNYISTVIVHPSYRGRRITEKLYREMLRETKLPLATRTWSTNYAHIHILDKLQFKTMAVLKNDRGRNIDTVYYMKTL